MSENIALIADSDLIGRNRRVEYMKKIGKAIVNAVAMCIFFCIMCFSNDLKEIVLCGIIANVFMMSFIYELRE